MFFVCGRAGLFFVAASRQQGLTWVATATYNPNFSFLLPLRGNKV
jgi:hypothetical protein